MLKIATKIVFVYNADSGLVAGLKDYFHKVLRPSTYQCRLCAVTYGPLGMKGDWRRFVTHLPFGVEFLHRDEFSARFPDSREEFPAAFLVDDGGIVSKLVSAADLAGVESLEDLKSLVERKVREAALA